MNPKYTVGLLTAFIGILIWLARTVGKQSAKLEAVQTEMERTAKERTRANKIISRVGNLDINDVHRRLHNTKSK